jgi:hypothetical protein
MNRCKILKLIALAVQRCEAFIDKMYNSIKDTKYQFKAQVKVKHAKYF